MKEILEKSGNFVRGKKWEPWKGYVSERNNQNFFYSVYIKLFLGPKNSM